MRLGDAAVCYVIGERGADDGSSEVRGIAVVLGHLRRALDGWGGIGIEVKRVSLAIHNRHAADPTAAQRAIDAAHARRPPWHPPPVAVPVAM